MLQKLYMQHEKIWFWGPRAGWRKGAVVSSSGRTVKVCEYVNDDHYRFHRLTPYRVLRRMAFQTPDTKAHGTTWTIPQCPQTTGSTLPIG